MESQRLPGKSLIPIGGRPIVDWVAARAGSSVRTDSVVFALPDAPTSDVLADHLERRGCSVVRGPEDDVLGRYLLAAEESSADVVIRTCADRPLVDARVIDATIAEHLRGSDDGLTFSHRPWGAEAWDYGFGVEVFGRATLVELGDRATMRRHREHVTLLLYEEAPERVRPLVVPEPLRGRMSGGRRFDVDRPDDVDRLEVLVAGLPVDAGSAEILARAYGERA